MIIDSNRSSAELPDHKCIVLRERGAKRCLPIWIYDFKAQTLGLKAQTPGAGRPTIYDLVSSLVKKFGLSVKYALINEFKENYFYAKLIIGAGEIKVEFDCRPSDALNIAAKVNAPVFAEQKVLDEAGVFLNENEELKPYGLNPGDFN